MAVFGCVLGFVLTMTLLGRSPYEAIGVAVAAGTAAGIITRALLDALSSFNTSRSDKPEQHPLPPIQAEATRLGVEAPTDLRPDFIQSEPTEEAS